jgi:hypothetical protein
VKNDIPTVFSVFQNLESSTWLSKKENKTFFGEEGSGGFPLFGNFAKKKFFWIF